ncbi:MULTISPECIES: alkaline phosphatase family protein [Mesorhizobium]|uniref:Phosphonate monoester hydrolase n=1 Tax=Mesorhizobium denitrificans TaxID=2294114 RepID=A0A371XFS8_9HYPH|nr:MULTISPECIES: alkaline phosphatase family protein [Mesorhizobium]RFC67884.1 phosphonate monoester hydrolase [Mesorhizobium denitrificans]
MLKRPNLLFITCDQWRGECLSAAGHPTVQTPNADALASDGVLFRRHYAGAAPCSPARACIYTGLYQMNNRVCRNGTPMDARHGTLAQAARGLGYEPTLFGYTDVSPDPRFFAPGDPVLRSYEGVLPGFFARQLLPEHQKQWLSWLRRQGVKVEYGYPEIHRPANGDVSRVTNAPPVYNREQTLAAFLTGEFLRWHGEQDDPWFAHISYLSPHPPFIVPEPFNTMYDPADGPAFYRAASWKDEARSHPYAKYELTKQKRSKFLPGQKGSVRDLTEGDFRTIRSIYYGMISEVDDQLGRIWHTLKSAGDWDNTIIVLTSDHAEMMGDHYMLGKGGYFDESYHLPLIIRSPSAHASKGGSVEQFTEAVDLMPTVIELLGGTAPAHLDGHSLATFLNGSTPSDWRNAAHWEFDFRSISSGEEKQPLGLKPQQCNLAVIRTEQHKYVHFGGGLPPLLFDLKDDPGELRNRADDPSHTGIRLEMAERLLAWRAEHLDQSLALSELTDQGIAGTYAAPNWRSGWR